MGTSDGILDMCRALADKGELSSLAQAVDEWIREHRRNGAYVRAHLPAILLNRYIVGYLRIPQAAVARWELAHPGWSEPVQSAVSNPSMLPMVMARVVEAIQAEIAARAD